jgi:hypothetical protein
LQKTVDDAVNNGLSADVVIVIEDDDERLLNAFKYLVDKKVCGPLGRSKQLLISVSEVLEYRYAEIGDYVLDPVGNVTEKRARLGVCVVELIPDRWARLSADKFGDKSRFATAGVGGNKRDRGMKISFECMYETRPRQYVGNRARGHKLCAQEKARSLH